MMWPDRGAIRTYENYRSTFLVLYPVQKGWVRIITNLCPYKRLHEDRVDLRTSLVQFLSLDWEQHCKSLSFISASRLTSYSSFYSDSPPWQNSSLLHHHLVIFILCLISFDVISIPTIIVIIIFAVSFFSIIMLNFYILIHCTLIFVLFFVFLCLSLRHTLFYCYSSSPYRLLLRSRSAKQLQTWASSV